MRCHRSACRTGAFGVCTSAVGFRDPVPGGLALYEPEDESDQPGIKSATGTQYELAVSSVSLKCHTVMATAVHTIVIVKDVRQTALGRTRVSQRHGNRPQPTPRRARTA